MSKTTIDPQRTVLFVAPGVRVVGLIEAAGVSRDAAGVVLGEIEGGINWNGALQVVDGGTIIATAPIRVRDLVVNGTIKQGEGASVTIVADRLELGPRARVDADKLQVQSGGLGQTFGAIVNAALSMTQEGAFSDSDAPGESRTPTSASLVPVLQSRAQDGGPPSHTLPTASSPNGNEPLAHAA